MSDLPAKFISIIQQSSGPYFFWRSPEGEVLMAAGMRWVSKPSEDEDWRHWAMGPCDAEPGFPVIALAFFEPDAAASTEWEGFSPAQFYQPAIAVQIRGASVRTWGMDELDIASEAEDPVEEFGEPDGLILRAWDHKAYRERVERALLLLNEGTLEKVVLAHRNTVDMGQPFNLYRVLHAMLRQPHAFSICFSPDGQRFFLSATPERLGRIIDGQFETMALAGTLTRGVDSVPESEQLLTDEKERSEHAYVVEMIRTAANIFSSDVTAREVQVLELPHVRHIMTRISGRMREGRGMRHVIASLHPTPAVAGTPRTAAQELIAALEPFHRGLYAGCIGWFSGDGDGDAAVTIRSALVHGREALVWAGAGIVKGSSAAAEELETQAKLRTMLDILGA